MNKHIVLLYLLVAFLSLVTVLNAYRLSSFSEKQAELNEAQRKYNKEVNLFTTNTVLLMDRIVYIIKKGDRL